MFVMSVYALVSATIVVTSTKKEQILVGRILNCKARTTTPYSLGDDL